MWYCNYESIGIVPDARGQFVHNLLNWKNRTHASQNGISNDAWTKATDFDSDTEVKGTFFFVVEEGGTNFNSGFLCTNTWDFSIGGSPALTVTQLPPEGAGQIKIRAGDKL